MTLRELFEKRNQLNVGLRELGIKINLCIDFLYGNNDWNFDVYHSIDTFIDIYSAYTSYDKAYIAQFINQPLIEKRESWGNEDQIVFIYKNNELIVLIVNIEVVHIV